LEPQDPKCIYVVGRVNSGKSTFVNRFLWYIGHKHQGTVHHKRTVGGVTRSPIPGTTLHFMSFGMPKGFRLVDTPGIPSKHQITSLLSEGIDLYGTVPRKKVNPISYVLHSGRSLLVGALARIDQVSGPITFVSSFFSLDVTLHVCRTSRAEGLVERKAGEFLFPPHNREDWSRLGPLVRHRVEVFGSSDRAWDDIVIAGMGWVAISGFGSKELDVWVPQGVKVFRRPSLLPHEMKSRGVTRFHVNHRARTPRIYRKKRTIVKARRDKELRDSLRREQMELETGHAAAVEVPDCSCCDREKSSIMSCSLFSFAATLARCSARWSAACSASSFNRNSSASASNSFRSSSSAAWLLPELPPPKSHIPQKVACCPVEGAGGDRQP